MIGYAVAAGLIIIYIIVNYGVKGEEGQVNRLVCGRTGLSYSYSMGCFAIERVYVELDYYSGFQFRSNATYSVNAV